MRVALALLLSTATLPLGFVLAEDKPDVAVAVAKIEALGGQIQRDDDQNGAVVTIGLVGNEQLKDEDLAFLKSLTSLRQLYLGNTSVSDAGLKHIGGLKELRVLGLIGTKVTDAGLKELVELKNLTNLRLSGTQTTEAGQKQLQESLPGLQILPQRAARKEGVLPGDKPEVAAAITKIEALDGEIERGNDNTVTTVTLVGSTKLKDEDLQLLKPLTNLRQLYLGNTSTSDTGLKHIGGLTELRVLGLIGTKVSDAGLKELAGLRNLEDLYLATTAVTEEGLQELVSLENLQNLILPESVVTDAGLKVLGKLQNLKQLDLGQAKITDAGLKELGDLKNLDGLSLEGTGITDAGLKDLGKLPKLTQLDLSQTKISDTGLKELAKLKNLTLLLVAGTQVTEAGLKELKYALPKLETNRGARRVLGRGASESRPSDTEFVFQVLTTTGQPVVGAKVTQQWFQVSGSNHQFQLDEKLFPPDAKLFPPAMTNAEGLARFVIPDDEALAKAGYPPQRESRVRETLRQPILFVRLRVDHPDHPRWNDGVFAREAAPIVLPDSATLVVRAHRGEDQTPVRNLYPVLSQSWEGTDSSEVDGVLTIRRVDLTSKKASRWLRIVHASNDAPAWFSELIDLKQQRGPVISLDVVLKPGVRVEGRLPENVTRPVANGRIVAEIANGAEFPNGWYWRAAADIAPNGTFVLESLPENENLQITAFCDGWVSRSPSSDEVKAYAAQNPFAAPDYENRLQRKVYAAFPRLYRLNAPVIEAIVPMGRTSAAEVLVVDEKEEPIENAWVGFSPNVLWFSGGAGLLGQGNDQLAMIRAELASGKRRTEEPAWKPGDNRYAAKTNAKGLATVLDLPAGATGEPAEPREFAFHVEHDDYVSAAPPTDDRRRFRTSTIQLVPGQTGSVTVRMKRK